MGIPRLSQDLQAYAEGVILGMSMQPLNVGTIDLLVIDGPSLVYHVYNRLLAYRASRSPVLDGGFPSYSEIDQGFQHFLLDLEKRGVRIHHIFFDGGLPPSKRSVRLDRMEKVRIQLERYRMQRPLDPMMTSIGDIQFEDALWNTSFISTKKATPPPPPFMVASVIEFLRASKWSHLVSVVSGEADSFCAQAACETSAAVLTNDSDLAVHELGPKSSLAMLGSIEKKFSGQGKGKYSLAILSLHPKTISERLGVPSLVHFAFERYMDSSISTAMVRERARDKPRLENLRVQFNEFAEQYLPPQPQMTTKVPSPLGGIDPRTAELIVSTPGFPHIYLTSLLEDPSRDSAWSYGSDIRGLAYSLLAWSSLISQPEAVVEYARKGRRITSTAVLQLKSSQLQHQLHQWVNTLEKSYTTYPDTVATPANEPERTSLLLNWHLLGSNTVHQQLLARGKQPVPLSLLHGTVGLTKQHRNGSLRVTWDEIHFLAQVHAVLYSFRILKQIAEYVLRVRCQDPGQAPGQGQGRPPKSTDNGNYGDEAQTTQNDHDPIEVLIRELSAKLKDMPSIAALFLSVSDLRTRFH
ncbi:uncharacterized protein A1O9_03976 [Exophiala aquamarina CBS 119918]|uniref:Asteroid domain-containing protein n=1 Tax=Exophiala aquamarina CBS 119918 TaxID=1182545 RepID=A0A072PHA3_9EURO|nr:uncharacterized protein A1O9_03976 [Exophiala aquamarina CBS 119918]KEF59132.1 hypothetical protein A1O9_03976 [Exophiala aquamarina CBS 119918]